MRNIFVEIVIMSGSRCLSLTLVLAVLFAPCYLGAQHMNKPPVSRTPADEECVADLHRIYKLLKQYLHHSGGALGFPSNLDALYPMAKEPKPFICPADKELETAVKPNTFRTSYEIVSDPLEPKLSTTPASKIAIVAEKRANHNGQRFVLFYDGFVRALDDADFERLKGNAFIDRGRTDTEH